MATVTRTPRGISDSLEIAAYIARQSGTLEYGNRWLDDLDAKLQQYARQPEMGTLYHELLPELRYFTFKK